MPLSAAQRGVWYQQEALGYRADFHIVVYLDWPGRLDRQRLETALREVLAQNDALSLRFERIDGRPSQSFFLQTDFRLETLDFRTEADALSWMRRQGDYPFDLETGPLHRFALLHVGDGRSLFFCAFHHLLLDGWGLTLFLQRVSQAYSAPTDSTSANQHRQSFGQILRTDPKAVRPEEDSTARHFWQDLMEDPPQPLLDELADRGESGDWDDVAIASQSLAPEIWTHLAAMARDSGMSPATLIIGLLSGYLSRISGQRDLVVAVPRLARSRKSLRSIAMLVNLPPLRLKIHAKQTLMDLGLSVREAVRDSEKQAHYPRYEIQRLLRQYESGLEDLLNVSINVETFQQSFSFDGLQARFRGLRHGPEAGVAFALVDFDALGQPDLELRYNTARLDGPTADRHLDRLVGLLSALVREPDLPVCEWPVLTADEYRQVVENFSSGTPPSRRPELVLERFAENVIRHPDKTAVVDSTRQLSFLELDGESDRLAILLTKRGLGEEDFVGVCLPRGIDVVICLLAIWKARATAVVLDPTDPEDRLAMLLEKVRARAFVVNNASAGLANLVARAGLEETICLAIDDAKTIDRGGLEEQAPAQPTANAPNLAYVVHTSGSTGRPKAVAITHGSYAKALAAKAEVYGAGENEVYFALTSLSFDVFMEDIGLPLIIGATLVFVTHEDMLNASRMETLTKRFTPTFLHTVPSVWRRILDAGVRIPAEARLITCGEALSADLAARLRPLGYGLWNMYGPAEATIDVTAHRPTEESPSSIGRPLGENRVYVVDDWLTPRPVGFVGELVIGGPQVARGYLGMPRETAERFVADPFTEEPGERLYRTGDLARWRPDGTLEFLGRSDHQVKVRGMRIELGEIEAAIHADDGVSHTVVVGQKTETGEIDLIAFVEGRQRGLDPDALLGRLARRLPRHFLPQEIVVVDHWPQTATGKIDRNTLPLPKHSKRDHEFPMPLSEEEAFLCKRMADLLEGERGRAIAVGPEDSFFKLGGHSLLAVQLLAELHQDQGLALSLRDLFESPSPRALAQLLISSGRRQSNRIQPIPADQTLPLSSEQRRMLLLMRLHGETPMYNESVVLRLNGPLDRQALEGAVEDLVGRHEVLRTNLVLDGGDGWQNPRPVDRPLLETRVLDTSDGDGRLTSLLRGTIDAPYDLAVELPFRALLIRLEEERHVLCLAFHHAACDNWSLGHVLFPELPQLYASRCNLETPALPPLQLSYKDYSAWQKTPAQTAKRARDLVYWQEALIGIPELTSLPLDHPRPHRPTREGGRITVDVLPSLWSRLENFAKDKGATPFMVLLAALAVLLRRHGAERDVVIGTPSVYRPQADLWRVFGYFGNTLPLRLQINEEWSFDAIVEAAKETTLGALAHQEAPMEEIIEVLGHRPSTRHTPLFQVALMVHAYVPADHFALPGLNAELVDAAPPIAKFDLTFDVTPGEDRTSVVLEYASELFEPETAQKLLVSLFSVLESGIEAPDRPIWQLETGFDAPKDNHTDSKEERAALAADLATVFEQVAERSAEEVAVDDGEKTLSFRDFNRAANQLARRLIARGIGPEAKVGLHLDRSMDLPLLLIAIWKAGGAYVPFDRNLPVERISFMLQDCDCALLITEDDTPASAIKRHAKQMVSLAKLHAEARLESTANLKKEELRGALTAQSLAYALYTSGSTGQPKAVQVPQVAAISMALNQSSRLDGGAGARVGQYCSISFDVSMSDMLSLLCGATVVIIPESIRLDARAIASFLERTSVSAVLMPPAILNALPLGPDHPLATLISGGDVGSAKTLREQAAFRRTMNAYGPAECAVVATAHEVSADEEGDAVPIGQPLDRVTTYVLDRYLQPCPPMAPGVLFIGGAQVGRGYLARPALTAETFLPDPFSKSTGARMYRTGDLVKKRHDGSIEFLGREDLQIKIRGMRVELGEIESCLERLAGVASSAVIYSKQEQSEPRLMAFVRLSEEGARAEAFDAEALRQSLMLQLPAHMVPHRFYQVSDWPMTASGKIDRMALRVPDEQKATFARAPANLREAEVCKIFGSLLELDEAVDPEADFFRLGGHSLLAMRLLVGIEKAFGRALPLSLLFQEAPTPRRLAALLDKPMGPHSPQVEHYSRSEAWPLSPFQEGLWFHSELSPEATDYSVPMVFRLRGKIDRARLCSAIAKLVERHEALRTAFLKSGGQGRQRVTMPAQDAEILEFLDLRGLSQAEANQQVQQWLRQPIDLTSGRPFRAMLSILGEQRGLFCMLAHHLVLDAWSTDNLVRDLSLLYQAECADGEAELPPLAVQSLDVAQEMRSRLTSERTEQLTQYWKERLAGAPSTLALPGDRPRPSQRSDRGFGIPLAVSESSVAAIRRLAQSESTTPFIVLESLFAAWLHRISGARDIVVGSPFADRQSAASMPLVGYFLNTLPLRHRISGEDTFSDLVTRSRAEVVGDLAHGDLPFDAIVRATNPERSSSYHPLFQTFLNFTETVAADLELPGLEAQWMSPDRTIMKFDLELSLRQSCDGWRGSMSFAEDLFEIGSGERFAASFLHFLDAAVARPDRPIWQQPLADDLDHFVAGTARRSPHGTIVDAVEACATLHPDAPAIEGQGLTISYGRLNAEANRLARTLRGKGIANGKRVGVSMRGSADLVLAFLAIAKAGGCYLPLEPSHPSDRLGALIERTECDFVLAQQLTLSHFAPLVERRDNLEAIDFEDLKAAASANPSGNLELEEAEGGPSPQSLVYIVSTSGSTGAPKLIAVEHRHLTSFIAWLASDFGEGEAPRIGLRTTIGFDAICREIWWPLTTGGTVILMEEEPQEDRLAALLAAIQDHKADSLSLVPSLLSALLDHKDSEKLAGLRRVYSSGEVLPRATIARFHTTLPNCNLFNGYGPSETTLNVAGLSIGAQDDTRESSIGVARGGNRLYILDPYLGACLPGVVGEIFIAGDQVSRGYVGDPRQTADRFLPDPWSPEPGTKMYRTGDLGRLNADGSVDFLGRRDFQIKLRGMRIEMGEVEAALNRHSAIKTAVATAQTLAEGGQRLVAYLVFRDAAAQVSPADLRRFLLESLPDYMVPSLFITLDAVPRTATGKVDRSSLPAAPIAAPAQEAEQPNSGLEELLCNQAAELLEVGAVGPNQNFFEIGGYSLLGLRYVSTLEARLGRAVPVRLLIEAVSFRDLAHRLTLVERPGYRPLVHLTSTSTEGGPISKPLLVCVHPAGGMGSVYRPLAARLSERWDVYALQARGLNVGETRFDDLEEMLSCYGKALGDVLGDRQFSLLGWSFGAKVAAQLTSRLYASGRRHQEHLYLLDGGTASRVARASSFDVFVGELVKLLSPDPNQDAMSEMDGLRQSFIAAGMMPEHASHEADEALLKLLNMMYDDDLMAREFKPARIETPLTIFTAVDNPIRASDPSLGWRAWSRSFRTIDLPGRHHDLLQGGSMEQIVSILLKDAADVGRDSPTGKKNSNG